MNKKPEKALPILDGYYAGVPYPKPGDTSLEAQRIRDNVAKNHYWTDGTPRLFVYPVNGRNI